MHNTQQIMKTKESKIAPPVGSKFAIGHSVFSAFEPIGTFCLFMEKCKRNTFIEILMTSLHAEYTTDKHVRFS